MPDNCTKDINNGTLLNRCPTDAEKFLLINEAGDDFLLLTWLKLKQCLQSYINPVPDDFYTEDDQWYMAKLNEHQYDNYIAVIRILILATTKLNINAMWQLEHKIVIRRLALVNGGIPVIISDESIGTDSKDTDAQPMDWRFVNSPTNFDIEVRGLAAKQVHWRLKFEKIVTQIIT